MNNKTILSHEMPRQQVLVSRGTKTFLFQRQKHWKYLEKSFTGLHGKVEAEEGSRAGF